MYKLLSFFNSLTTDSREKGENEALGALYNTMMVWFEGVG